MPFYALQLVPRLAVCMHEATTRPARALAAAHHSANGSRRVCTQVFNCAQLRLTLVGPQVGAPRCARAVPGSAAAVRLSLSGWAVAECVSERAVLTGAGCPRSRGSCRTASRRWRCRRTSRSPPCARTSWSASACTGAPRGWRAWPVCAAPYHTGCPRLARRSSASSHASPAPQRAALHTCMHESAHREHGARWRATSGGRAGRQCRDAAGPPRRHPAAAGARRPAAEPGVRPAAAGLGGRRVRRAPGAPPPRLRPRASRPGRARTAPESCAALHRALRLLCALLYRTAYRSLRRAHTWYQARTGVPSRSLTVHGSAAPAVLAIDGPRSLLLLRPAARMPCHSYS